MRIEWVESPDRFRELAEPWPYVGGGLLPYLRHAWFDAWLHAFGEGAAVATPVAWEGDRMVACLPAVRAGLDVRSMANWETPLFAPVATEPVHAATVVESAVERSRRALVLDAIALAGEAERAVEDGARDGGYRTLARHWQTSPLIETTGSLAEYMESTRPQWMKRLARYRRKMDRDLGLELSVAELPADAGSAFEECLRLEAAGWKGGSGTAILSSPATTGFYRAVFEMLRRSGELRLSLLRLDGRLAAFDIGFLFGDRLYSLKTGFDETQSKVVPGLVLRLSIVEHCFEHGLAANELLGGDLPWKRNFATASREHRTLRCYPTTVTGRAARFGDAYARPALGRVRRIIRIRRPADGARSR
jgi:CelD/BcsL family acetyltransferase involved in cellulose biosynthesis